MKNFATNTRLAFLLAVSLSTVAGANPLRCPNAAFDATRCEAIRADALKVGCINEAVYNQLRAENRFPACVMSTQVGDCPCGCFAMDTVIDVISRRDGKSGEMMAWLLFDNWEQFGVAALQDDARLSDIRLTARDIKQATVGKENVPIVVLTLSNGRTLRLTEKHPVMKHTGEMFTAREVTRGTRVLDRDGHPVTITNVKRQREEGNVYNFETNGSTLASHIIVAEGVLVGDLAWQNALEEELGGVAIRN